MKNSDLYNDTKKRKATANEIAKHLIVDSMYSIMLNEAYGCENLTEEEINEIEKHFSKHIQAIQKKFNLDHILVK